MAFSHKLFNPTPFEVKIPYHRGISIVVPADGFCNISTDQMQDLLPGQPGSEEVKQLLESYGVFLEDTDREFNSQALQAIKACIRRKRERYNEALHRQQELCTAQNLPADEDDPSMQNRLKRIGLFTLKADIQKLEARQVIYEKVVTEEEEDFGGLRAPRLDPDRTVFVLDPPKQFATPLAMEIFLNENPDIRAKHEEFLGVKKGGE